ncbi:LOW QUALITY PROTEIN: phospholipase D A [Alosa alosa]|uniref:phospholipase D A n=1 Tax=Alosa sapidissima TaxID=34773 RepID=UPI001C09DA31|nr:phospholipase D A [Alosa sapidissima]XP_048093799.1 LOW QUALITY PROTEIN: phospholipase D A [Alosa alosa]
MTSSTSPPVFIDKDGVAVRFKKRKARFTFSEVHILLDEVRKNRHIVVGKFNYGVPSSVKKRTWAEITARINEIGECEREVTEVIKKWSDMKCDTKRKVAGIRSRVTSLPKRRFLREFTPTENIICNILELDNKQGGQRPSNSSNGNGNSAAIGLGEEEDGPGEDDDDMDMDIAGMGSLHCSPEAGEGDRGVGTSALDSPSTMPPPFETSASTSVPSTSSMTTPPPPPLPGSKDDNTEGNSLFDSSGDTSFEMSFEMPFTEDSNQQADLEDDQANTSRLSTSTPTPTASASANNNNSNTSVGAVHRSETSLFPPPSSSSTVPPPPQPPTSAPSLSVRPADRDRAGGGSAVAVCGMDVSRAAVMSVEEQHMSNALLETVSRSLELLAESVQQLAETQQEFMSESLRLQRDTVQVLRDFASGAMTLMHDKLNGRPAL